MGHVTIDARDMAEKTAKVNNQSIKLTFSSACSTPVAICCSVVRDSYSLGSIWSSRRTGRRVFVFSFLYRTFRVAMAGGLRRAV